ncbi:MAG: MFS transporter, partial [Pseudonocardiales bacterium]|nr:MFS transporter [Pseudonocardiales bacterium]
MAATLARLGDAGAGVGVVLLAVSRAGIGGALVGGLLAAALTVPHVCGGWLGRAVDRAHDVRRPLAAGCAVYAVALGLAVGLLAAGWPWPAGAALLVAGLCGPLLTGGLSSLVAGLAVAPDRAHGFDAITYAVAGSAGPAAVAGIAAVVSPAVGLWAVAALVLLAAVLIHFLPVAPRNRALPERPAGSAGALLLTVRPLRRVMLTTLAAAATGGAIGVAAVLLAVDLSGESANGAWLICALGLGNLGGSLVVVARPPRGDAVRRSLGFAAALGGGYLLVGAAPSYPAAIAALAVVGLLTAPWVTATLDARGEHAPPGRRGQVFVAMAGWKIAAASAGSALAGAAAGLGPRPVIVIGAGVTLVCVV